MQYTTNFKFKKPDYTDSVDIADLNYNADLIDTELTATASAVKKAYDKAVEAFQSASDGKTLVANAVTNKGIEASPTDTFALLADKIGQISTGKKFASGSKVANSFADFEYYKSTSTMSKVTFLEVTGLDFKPSCIIAIESSTISTMSIYCPTEQFPDCLFTFSCSSDNDYSAVGRRYKLKSPAYIIDGGFKIPTSNIMSSATYIWFAFE